METDLKLILSRLSSITPGDSLSTQATQVLKAISGEDKQFDFPSGTKLGFDASITHTLLNNPFIEGINTEVAQCVKTDQVPSTSTIRTSVLSEAQFFNPSTHTTTSISSFPDGKSFTGRVPANTMGHDSSPTSFVHVITLTKNTGGSFAVSLVGNVSIPIANNTQYVWPIHWYEEDTGEYMGYLSVPNRFSEAILGASVVEGRANTTIYNMRMSTLNAPTLIDNGREFIAADSASVYNILHLDLINDVATESGLHIAIRTSANLGIPQLVDVLWSYHG